jgi:hypothetical protein
MTPTLPTPSRISGARVLLLAEGLAVFVAAVWGYVALAGNGWLFALLLLAPDLAMVGYVWGARVGALTYNLAHTLVVPAALLAAGVLMGAPLLAQLALIWLAHIGMDRAVGYGFKYASGFKDTHMGRV